MTTNSTTVNTAAQLVHASRTAYTQKWSFVGVFAWVLLVSVGVAGKLDVLPEPAKTEAIATNTQAVVTMPVVTTSPELPTKLEIPSIGLSQTVSNPNSTDVEVLDHELLTGTVRYPTSAKLGAQGNVIIFGHSSYLPIVRNQAFKALNGIQKLKEGDLIKVTGEGHVYTYAVESVDTESTTSDAIPLSVEGSKLTLATCDSFGAKTSRFVVTAKLVETSALY